MSSTNTRGGRSFALGLLLLFAACRKAPPPPPKAPPVAAIVNGAPIALARVQLELDRIRRPSDGAQAAPPENVPALAHAVLSTLIERAIVVGRAKTAGYSVSDAEVQRATDALAEDARKGGESFVERLRADGENMEVLSDEMRERLLAERYVAEQTRAEHASPAETRAWYEQHKAEFETPDEVHAQQIVVASADEAKSLLDQLRKGASFEALARAHSISPDAKSGGDLGFFARGRMPKAFDEACFPLGNGPTASMSSRSWAAAGPGGAASTRSSRRPNAGPPRTSARRRSASCWPSCTRPQRSRSTRHRSRCCARLRAP
jgi:hypothetical protein